MPTTDLELRLTRLEKSARRWKLAACSLALLAIAGLAMGQGIVIGGGTGGMKAPTITADNVIANKSLTLNDSKGKARILITTENDTPLIHFKDADGNALLSLSIEQNAAHILILDAKGKRLFAAP